MSTNPTSIVPTPRDLQRAAALLAAYAIGDELGLAVNLQQAEDAGRWLQTMTAVLSILNRVAPELRQRGEVLSATATAFADFDPASR